MRCNPLHLSLSMAVSKCMSHLVSVSPRGRAALALMTPSLVTLSGDSCVRAAHTDPTGAQVVTCAKLRVCCCAEAGSEGRRPRSSDEAGSCQVEGKLVLHDRYSIWLHMRIHQAPKAILARIHTPCAPLVVTRCRAVTRPSDRRTRAAPYLCLISKLNLSGCALSLA